MVEKNQKVAKQTEKQTKNLEDYLTVLLLAGTDTLVLRKTADSRIFINTEDSIIINKANLILILNFLVKKGLISSKVIEGMLEEAHTL